MQGKALHVNYEFNNSYLLIFICHVLDYILGKCLSYLPKLTLNPSSHTKQPSSVLDVDRVWASVLLFVCKWELNVNLKEWVYQYSIYYDDQCFDGSLISLQTIMVFILSCFHSFTHILLQKKEEGRFHSGAHLLLEGVLKLHPIGRG